MSMAAEFAVLFSKDQVALEAFFRWRKVADGPVEGRDAALANMRDARQRCLAAGVDWSRVPRPPDRSGAPDRVRPAPAGRAAPPPRPAPAGGPGPEPNPLVSVRLAADIALRSAPPAPAPARPGAAPAGMPPAGGVPAAAGPSATGDVGAGAPASSVPPDAGMSAAAGYGLAGADALTVDADWSWLGTGAHPAAADPGAGAFLQGPDGTAWYRDAQGAAYGVGADGTHLALSPGGDLYGEATDGSIYAWTTDGGPIMLGDDGQLWTSGAAEPAPVSYDAQFDVADPYEWTDASAAPEEFVSDPLLGYGDENAPGTELVDDPAADPNPIDPVYGADVSLEPGELDLGAESSFGADAGGWDDGSMLS